MNNAKCFKEFAKYTSLNVLGMIGLSCYILADTFFVSKGLGANGLTALNLAIPIYSFINGSGLMLGMGGATKYSILKSQDKTRDANRAFTNTVLFTLGLALVFFAIGVFLSGAITRLLGADDIVYQMSKTYLQVILLFAPMFMLNNVLLCFVRNDGAPQLSMLAMIGGSLSNIILDYIFIFPCNMGIFGAVLATGLAPIISMLILSPYFLKKRNQFQLIRCSISWKLISNIVSTGLPSLITEVSSGIVIIVFNKIILGLQGNTGVAAYGVIANLSLVVISIYTGVAQGIQPILSKNYGTGNKKDIKQILRYSLVTVLAVSGIVYSSVFFGADFIASIFNSEQNALLQSIAVTGLKIYFIACVFAGFNIILSVYFTSTEHARPAHIISLLRGFIVIIPMAFLLSSIGGMIGVWFTFPTTELIVAIIGLTLYLLSRRKVN
ncbi:putative efflux protein, MATE family [Anaerosporobacter mobilis DSM 15930]|uniref:Multidrug export protein MepA n=1 Tax=Anaerosporobacter mobilis DSM 15930 TaxID=1120996 RepID=A0A1M7N6I9_9FIRM|nr:MATE family efflux transporter [Anaerosporobacter mobilis]SHM98638.1 putative efflux protein, MATE family [Anaerosporobacter mobilis DSM 15930]